MRKEEKKRFKERNGIKDAMCSRILHFSCDSIWQRRLRAIAVNFYHGIPLM